MICDKNASETQKQTIQRKDVFRYDSLFWLFMLGSVLGFMIEGIWCIFRYGGWQNHSALIWGPFCIIYGLGAVAVYLTVPFLQNKGLLTQFGIYCLIGAAIEFFSSLFQETCFGSVSWNYSKHFLNIGGRVSFKMALAWGALGILFIRYICPPVARLLRRMHSRTFMILCGVLTVFMLTNILASSCALLRWQERRDGMPASNRVEQWFDANYGDDVMASIYVNMRFE